VAPAALLYLLLFVAPFGNLTLYSFYDYSRLTGVIKVLSAKNYLRFWLDAFYLSILVRTLRVALLATVATLLVGYPIAVFMSRATPRVRGWVTLLILSPLLVSVVVRSFGWLIVLGPNGLIDSTLRAIGIADVKILHTETAIVIGLVNVFLPYLVLSVVASLQAIDPAVPRAAATLGARRWQVFWHVTLPLSLPGVLAGCLIVFSLGASAFVTPALLGGAEYKVLSVLIYQQTMILQNWPFGAAVAFALLLIVLLLITVQARLLERGRFGVVFH
jgi:putative spermidine/putrescine transport system permease protein